MLAHPWNGITTYGLQALIRERPSTAWSIRRCFEHWKIKNFHRSTFGCFPHYVGTEQDVFLAVLNSAQHVVFDKETF